MTDMNLKRITSAALIVCFVSSSAAAGPIRDQMEREVSRIVREQGQVGRSRGPNPYLWPGIAVVAGGLVLAVIGFTDETGAEAGISDPFNPRITVDVKHNTALGITGLGVAGAGVALLMIGEGKRQPVGPSLGAGLRAVAIRF